MSEKDNGGPAFPRAAGDYSGTRNGNGAQSGMTLRDHFAGLAMQSMVRLHMLDKVEYHQRSVAEQAYRMADAMLKARGN